jgi:hypothetical protein
VTLSCICRGNVAPFRHSEDCPATNAWATADATIPEKWGECAKAFYDPELNARFFHVAGDSDDNGTLWVFRLKEGEW